MGRKIYEVIQKPVTIIVEGVDCSGKSYLVQALSKKYPGLVIKLTCRPRYDDIRETNHYKQYVYSLLEYLNCNHHDKTIILDRFFSSELAYSQVKRGYDAFEDKVYKRMSDVIEKIDPLFIYCDPGKEVIINRLRVRGDDYINEEDIDALRERYERFFNETKMYKLRIDTSKTAEEMLELIKEELEIYEHTRN